MTLNIESAHSKEVLKARLEALYMHNHWASLPKGIFGRSNQYKFTIGVENGPPFAWPGRGKINGKIITNNHGSQFIGEFNSPAIATITPFICMVLMIGIMPENVLPLVLICIVFCLFGYCLVKSDHSLLEQVLNEAAGNYG
jgi:hypothetical protein